MTAKGSTCGPTVTTKSVNLSEESGEYPFAGYKKVLGEIYRRVRERDGISVLDIGFGTGVLTSRLYDAGYQITGIDFSEKMIGIARRRMPNALLIQWDFSKGLPKGLEGRHFDDIVSTYALHHLTDAEKPGFVRTLSGLLRPGGRILIGDVSFTTRRELELCREKYEKFWDPGEYYFVAEELEKSLGNGFACEYRKLSHCAGVLSVVTA